MDQRPIEAILFDLGNVLVDFDHIIAARRVSRSCDKTAQEIYEMFFDSELTRLFEEGRIVPEEFFAKVKEALNLKLGYADFVLIWNEIFFLSEKNRRVYDLAEALRKSYKLAMITNINILHFEYVKKNFPIFSPFRYVVTSCEVGRQKPDPLIYQRATDLLETVPEQTFYTDDRQDLVREAASLGIRAYVFAGVEQLRKDLLAAGIRINYDAPLSNTPRPR